MRRFEKTNDVVVCFDFSVWKQERNIIYFQHLTTEDTANWVRMWTDMHGGYSNPIAEYSLDAEYKAAIDMSDYIRAYPGVQHVYVECQNGEAINIPLAVVGLINPESVIVPSDRAREIFNSTFGTNYRSVVVPPSRMIASISESILLRGEFWPNNNDVVRGIYCIDKCADGDDVQINSNEIEFSFEQESWLAFDDDNVHNVVQRGSICPMECEKRYAAVRWVSFTGATRLHTFEVRDCTREAVDVVKLETIDGSWNQIKGRVDGLKLFIDGLDAYDVWYYSDIVTSSKVEVSLDGFSWQQVEVVAKSATTPNSNEGALGKVEIQINWRKYDSVNM